jgi:hypothetical protein
MPGLRDGGLAEGEAGVIDLAAGLCGAEGVE